MWTVEQAANKHAFSWGATGSSLRASRLVTPQAIATKDSSLRHLALPADNRSFRRLDVNMCMHLTSRNYPGAFAAPFYCTISPFSGYVLDERAPTKQSFGKFEPTHNVILCLNSQL